MQISNIAAYKFVSIPDPEEWRQPLKERCLELGILGNILLATEGINFFITGDRSSTAAFIEYLCNDGRFGGAFTDLEFKESISDSQPFKRIVVRIKNEIITMKHPTIIPGAERAPAVKPTTLKRWLDQGHDDDGRELVLLDTRNNYEVAIGTFTGAIDLNIDNFSEFPQAYEGTAEDTRAKLKEKTVVSFCTGGIRCEKAALFLRELNLDRIYQLDGGILRYFEDVGGEHWQGECFVFDRRVALDTALQPTKQEYSVTAPPERNAKYMKWLAAQQNRTDSTSPAATPAEDKG